MEKNAFFIALVGIEPFTLRLAIARFIAWLFDQLMWMMAKKTITMVYCARSSACRANASAIASSFGRRK